jgi:DNA-binding SARP family transcriptional activator/tetratricopeptide (TPR) repeat protein
MHYRLLGPLEVVGDDGRAIAFGGDKERILLAALLLGANRVVSAARLIDAMWGENPPLTAVNALQAQVSRLRKKLAEGSGSVTVLDREPSGYRLVVGTDEFDVARFQELVDAGADTPLEVSARLSEALGIWTGPALVDVDSDVLTAEAVRLDELRLVTLERRLEADLALGRHRQVIPELEVLVADQPLRERFRGQLMLALYRSDRQADALGVYRQTRDILAGQLGIDPSPALQALELAILNQSTDLDVPVEAMVGDGEACPAPTVRSGVGVSPLEALPEGVVTFLLTDIVGSTALLRDVGVESYDVLLQEHRDLIRQSVVEHGGVAVDREGDGTLSAFADTCSAVEAAVALQEALAEHDWLGPRVRVRAGIHTGEAKLSGGRDYVSLALHQAARIAAAAGPGQVLCSPEVASDQPAIGAFWLKDFPVPVVLHQARPADDGSTPSAPRADVGIDEPGGLLVGRDADVGALRERSGVVVLVGPAGVGKSRLAHEIAWLLGACGRPVVRISLDHGFGDKPGARAVVLVDNADDVPHLDSLVEGWDRDDTLVLVTRRTEVAGLTCYPVSPLGTEDAIWLLAHLASASGAPAWDRDELAELATAVDGIPLALEMVAPRLVERSPADVVQVLREAPDRDPLHSVLAELLAQCLSDEVEVLGALNAFRGPVTEAALHAVYDSADLHGHLDRLVYRGLVRRESTGRDFRYLLPNALRRQLLVPKNTVRLAHARWVLAEAERAWTPAYAPELDDVATEVVAALAAGLPLDEQVRLLVALRGYLSLHHQRTAMTAVSQVLELLPDGDPRRAAVLDVAAAAAKRCWHPDMHRLAEELITESVLVGDATLEVRGLLMADRAGLGLDERRRRAARAAELLPELELDRRRADRGAHLMRGNVAFAAGDLLGARDCFRAACSVAESLDDLFNQGVASWSLSELAEEAGDRVRALDEARRAVHCFAAAGLHDMAARMCLRVAGLQRLQRIDPSETLAEAELAARRAGSNALLGQVAALRRA